MNELTPFHIALPVHDIKICREFYETNFLCTPGRESDHWVDLNFYGHQFVLHLDENIKSKTIQNEMDDHAIPVPHCGVILKWDQWQELAQRLQNNKVEFIVKPYMRFEGLPGEQGTLFIKDPAGNALEFKTFKDFSQIFATN